MQVCSAADLVALTPNDVFVKLKMFLMMVCFLFGLMHVFAYAASRRDMFDRRVLRARLMDPAQCEFAERGGEGAWTWNLRQDPAADGAEVFQLTGSGVNFAGICGIPYARIRAAVPEDILAGKTQHMVGRAKGLSAGWLKQAQALKRRRSQLGPGVRHPSCLAQTHSCRSLLTAPKASASSRSAAQKEIYVFMAPEFPAPQDVADDGTIDGVIDEGAFKDVNSAVQLMWGRGPKNAIERVKTLKSKGTMLKANAAAAVAAAAAAEADAERGGIAAHQAAPLADTGGAPLAAGALLPLETVAEEDPAPKIPKKANSKLAWGDDDAATSIQGRSRSASPASARATAWAGEIADAVGDGDSRHSAAASAKPASRPGSRGSSAGHSDRSGGARLSRGAGGRTPEFGRRSEDHLSPAPVGAVGGLWDAPSPISPDVVVDRDPLASDLSASFADRSHAGLPGMADLTPRQPPPAWASRGAGPVAEAAEGSAALSPDTAKGKKPRPASAVDSDDVRELLSTLIHTTRLYRIACAP